VLHKIRLERLAKYKHSNLFVQLVSYEEYEVFADLTTNNDLKSHDYSGGKE
jgi:hypothetical protein